LKSDCDKLTSDCSELDASLPDPTAYVRADLDVSLEDIVAT